MKKMLLSLFFYIISGFGISLVLTAGLGGSCINAFNNALSAISGIKLGTINCIINLFFIFLDNLLIREKLAINISKFIYIVCMRLVINFCFYHLLINIEITNYFLKLGIFYLGLCITGISIGICLSINAISLPIESVCVKIADKFNLSFIGIRYGLDFLFIFLSLCLSRTFKLPIFIREGTLLTLFLLPSIISFSKSITKKDEVI